MIPPRQLPLPGSPEAHAQGCTCPEPEPDQIRKHEELRLDRNCPVHGLAADNRERAAETGPIDTEGDMVDSASEPELRRSGG